MRVLKGSGLAGSVVLGLAVAMLWSSAGVTVFADSGALDGKTFVGQVCKKGQTTGDSDTLTFKDGRFHSLACDKYGFGDATYTATASGDVVAFESQTTSDRGTIQWKGTVKGDEVVGTSTFNRKKTWYNFFLPATEEKDFKATLQK